jgi:putative transcriptional regulator
LINTSYNNIANNFLGVVDLSGGNSATNLPGKFLVSSPYSKMNDMFDKSIIYILDHSSKGAVGVIINRMINKIPFSKIIDILKDKELDVSDDVAEDNYTSLSLYAGGPVERDRGLVLHTNDYKSNALFGSETEFSVSSSMDVFKALLLNKGPKKTLFVMGYTLWEKGQLEQEIENNFWNVIDARGDIIFMEDNNAKWTSLTNYFNTSLSVFSPSSGRC